jgi:hypothetical protein
LDEAGFAMTLSNAYSWSPVGKRFYVPYEAPQGRRVNAVGAVFHGTGGFGFVTRAKVPKTKRKAVSSLAVGLKACELGIIDGVLLVDFIWQIAGRPADAGEDWRRERPLVVVLDNYSVHHGAQVRQERAKWEAADIRLFYLPSYSPELSGIEPVWRDVKQHRMRRLSRSNLCQWKREVDAALQAKADDMTPATSLTECA